MKLRNKLAKISLTALFLTSLVAPATINTTAVHADAWSDMAEAGKEASKESEEQFGNHDYTNQDYLNNKNHSNESESNNSSNTTNTVNAIKGVISVNNPEKSYVAMVSFNDDGTASPVTNRALLNNTPWQTDRSRTLDGVKYYRVSTNEWVSETYVTNYEAL
ncbi:hypothetical protein [Companilactobacillus baiquanensis]|uniref:Surface layer protein A domain-containing protein n=1 Tax=Companilactobacillus baiquanensis TaxID=2486005 RepID=A0ABW1UZP0_9LACO|nr:hypothetical protein [Companilactobacillus baiquanensis]